MICTCSWPMNKWWYYVWDESADIKRMKMVVFSLIRWADGGVSSMLNEWARLVNQCPLHESLLITEACWKNAIVLTNWPLNEILPTRFDIASLLRNSDVLLRGLHSVLWLYINITIVKSIDLNCRFPAGIAVCPDLKFKGNYTPYF